MAVDAFSEKHSDSESIKEVSHVEDTIEDRKLLRKIDLQYVTQVNDCISMGLMLVHSLLPILTLLYLLSFLDRCAL